jgi:molybdopterin converting factor subunit 1
MKGMGMQIQVRLFATLRQQAGWKEKAIEIESGATVDQLVDLLERSEPGLRLRGRTLYAAVNMEYSNAEQRLEEGDEVAFFPPVSGGQR